MRQRLFRLVVGLVLAVSVFLCNSFVSMAASDTDSGILDCYVTAQYATANAYGFQSSTDSTGRIMGHIDYPLAIQLTVRLEGGYKYSGSIGFLITCSLPVDAQTYHTSYLGLGDIFTTGGFGNVSLSVTNSGSQNNGTSLRFTPKATFNDFYVPTTTYFVFNYTIHQTLAYSTTDPNGRLPIDVLNNISKSEDFVTSGFTRTLYDATGVGSAITDMGGDVINSQQQIAAAQASQSAQQHNEALHGFDNSQAGSINNNLQGGINDLDAVQDDIFNRAVDGIGGVSLDTDVFAPLTSSLSFVSTFMNGMFDSLQGFSLPITIGLVIVFCMLFLGYYKFWGG